jgi:hypothetical protein
MKSLLFITIFTITSFANTANIEDLQKEFKKEVLELNAYKKRFSSFLYEECGIDSVCYKRTVERMKTWESVQADKELKHLLTNKYSRLTYDDEYWHNLLNKLKNKDIDLSYTQFVSIIDLDKQLYIVTLWDQEKQEFEYIGKDLISSGNMNREGEVKYGEDHYLKTPAGVFKSKYGWRSEGKRGTDKASLGYGYKDRYIFYFGKQTSIRYNTFDQNRKKIYNPDKWQLIKDQLEFAVHSHKSSKPMGQPNSHGCIRMTDELNRFLDNNSILHKNMLEGEKWLHKYAQEPSEPKYHNLAGEYLIIFDKVY